MWEDATLDEDSPDDSPGRVQQLAHYNGQDSDPDGQDSDPDEDDDFDDEGQGEGPDIDVGDRTWDDDEAEALVDDGWDPFSFHASSSLGSYAEQANAGPRSHAGAGEYEQLAAKKRKALKRHPDPVPAIRKLARTRRDDDDDDDEDGAPEEEEEDEDSGGDEGEDEDGEGEEGEEEEDEEDEEGRGEPSGRTRADSYFGFTVDDISAMAENLGLAGGKGRRRRGGRKAKKTWTTKGGMTDEVYKLLGEASLGYAMGQYQEAVAKLRTAIRISPQVAESYELMGLCYEALGNAAGALDLFMLDAHLRRKDIMQWHHLATLSWQQGNVRQTVYCLDRVLRRDPADMATRRQRATLLALLGAHDKALEGFEALLAAAPTDNELARQVAQEARACGQLARGARALQAMVSARPEAASLHTYRALVELYEEVGDHQAALDVLLLAQATHATRPPPREPFPLELVAAAGICHLHLGQMPHAQQNFSILQRAGASRCRDLLLRVADTYHQLGHPSEALAFYKALCVDISPHFIEPDLCLKLGRAHLDAREWGPARECLAAVLDRQPDNAVARIAMSDYHLAQGDVEAALRVLEGPTTHDTSGEGGGGDACARDGDEPPTSGALLNLLPADGQPLAPSAATVSSQGPTCSPGVAAGMGVVLSAPSRSAGPPANGAGAAVADARAAAMARQELFYRHAHLLHRLGRWEPFLDLTVPQLRAAFAGTKGGLLVLPGRRPNRRWLHLHGVRPVVRAAGPADASTRTEEARGLMKMPSHLGQTTRMRRARNRGSKRGASAAQSPGEAASQGAGDGDGSADGKGKGKGQGRSRGAGSAMQAEASGGLNGGLAVQGAQGEEDGEGEEGQPRDEGEGDLEAEPPQDAPTERDDAELDDVHRMQRFLDDEHFLPLFLKVCRVLALRGHASAVMDLLLPAVSAACMTNSRVDHKSRVALKWVVIGVGLKFGAPPQAMLHLRELLLLPHAARWSGWNLCCCLLSRLQNPPPSMAKLLQRVVAQQPAAIPARLLLGLHAMATEACGAALAEVACAGAMDAATWRLPLVPLFLGLMHLSAAMSRSVRNRNREVLQAFAFFYQYEELRGSCQEVLYNLGRAYHQLGLVHLAVPYYERVLAIDIHTPAQIRSRSPQTVAEELELYDLRREAAHNLALIYIESGATNLARHIVDKFIVV